METMEIHVLLLPCPHSSPTVSLSDFKLFPASDFQFYNSGNGRGFFKCKEVDKAKKKSCYGIFVKKTRSKEGLRSSCIAQPETS